MPAWILFARLKNAEKFHFYYQLINIIPLRAEQVSEANLRSE
jgi:hypothetical protein